MEFLPVVAALAFPFVVPLWRRREGIAYKVRLAAKGEAAYIGVLLILLALGRPPVESVLAGVLVAVLVISQKPPRNRRIPQAIRRKKTAEWEAQHGKKLDPRKYELHHEVPFSRGGSHTAENLQFIEKTENRRRGAKSPWWDLLGH